ncbi:hypothetical protein [Gulosibacter massiliensis]|uniref:hypothetical protein n=1 Tax=Gulosibacter massiliensis TaxID=2479839 RepID=UPI000F6313AE|nr:hypothetical protein [Gulosibacter massiliensis]
MTDEKPQLGEGGLWKRSAYLLLIVAATAVVLFTWLRTPEIRIASDNAESGYSTWPCSYAGSARWDPPIVDEGRELSGDPNRQAYDLVILQMNLNDARADLACSEARVVQTNTLIVTSLAAAVLLFWGYHWLWAGNAPTDALVKPTTASGQRDNK